MIYMILICNFSEYLIIQTYSHYVFIVSLSIIIIHNHSHCSLLQTRLEPPTSRLFYESRCSR